MRKVRFKNIQKYNKKKNIGENSHLKGKNGNKGNIHHTDMLRETKKNVYYEGNTEEIEYRIKK